MSVFVSRLWIRNYNNWACPLPISRSLAGSWKEEKVQRLMHQTPSPHKHRTLQCSEMQMALACVWQEEPISLPLLFTYMGQSEFTGNGAEPSPFPWQECHLTQRYTISRFQLIYCTPPRIVNHWYLGQAVCIGTCWVLFLGHTGEPHKDFKIASSYLLSVPCHSRHTSLWGVWT